NIHTNCNATFLGYVPTKTAQEGGYLLTESGYTVGVYVGFDSNDPMKKGSTRISGSQGALPTWSKIAEALYDLEDVADHLDPVDLAFDGITLKYPDTGQYFVPVQHKKGGIRSNKNVGEQSTITPTTPAVLGHRSPEKESGFTAERRFIPFWLNQRP
ncbi:MAG: glycosyl transferase family 51, partial [Candidatus Electrothrix sp. ATG2]|nr:glycosyl transferase family 51 [Candidatus Electrothrix sp. ATG2]